MLRAGAEAVMLRTDALGISVIVWLPLSKAPAQPALVLRTAARQGAWMPQSFARQVGAGCKHQ